MINYIILKEKNVFKDISLDICNGLYIGSNPLSYILSTKKN